MRAPAVDIAEYLQTNGVGVIGSPTGWSIWVGQERPPKPNAVPPTTITLYDLPGEEPLYSSGIEHPAIQVRVRGSPGGYEAAYAKAVQIRDLLTSGSFFVGSTGYDGWIEGDVGHLGQDEGDRPIFVATYRLQRSEL